MVLGCDCDKRSDPSKEWAPFLLFFHNQPPSEIREGEAFFPVDVPRDSVDPFQYFHAVMDNIGDLLRQLSSSSCVSVWKIC